MTPEEETVLDLTARKNSLERDLAGARAVVNKSAHELEAARYQVRQAEDRLKHLVPALTFLRKEAEIVSFSEFYTINRLIRENRALVSQHNGCADTAQEKGKKAADQLKEIESQLETITTKLSDYGQVIAFPTPPQANLNDDNDDADYEV